MDDVLLAQLLTGMEAVAALIQPLEDASDDLVELSRLLRKLDKELDGIADLPERLYEQIDEVLT